MLLRMLSSLKYSHHHFMLLINFLCIVCKVPQVKIIFDGAALARISPSLNVTAGVGTATAASCPEPSKLCSHMDLEDRLEDDREKRKNAQDGYLNMMYNAINKLDIAAAKQGVFFRHNTRDPTC